MGTFTPEVRVVFLHIVVCICKFKLEENNALRSNPPEWHDIYDIMALV